MHTLLDNVAEFLWSQSLQVCVVCLVVLLACKLVRHSSAHWRYLLWLVVIAKCLTPPLVSVPVAVLPAKTSLTSMQSDTAQPIAQGDTLESPSALASETTVDQPSATTALNFEATRVSQALPANNKPRPMAWTISQWLVLAWLVGVSLLLGTVLTRMLAAQTSLIRSRVPTHEATRQAVSYACIQLGLRKAPKVYEIEWASQPFVWGWLRGDVYLPTNFGNTTTEEKRRAMLTHELAHVLRFDAGVNFMQNMVQAIFFFHPLVWLANKHLRQEREKCCDEIVLSTQAASPKVYCEAIIDMLSRQHASNNRPPALAVSGSRRNIQDRILSMLTPGRKFSIRPSRITLLALLLFAACALPTVLVLTARSGLTQSQADTKLPLELKTFQWKLVDQSGSPIQGAEVQTLGLRSKESPGTGFGWPFNELGNTQYVTDNHGQVNIQYPVQFGLPGHRETTTTLILQAKHPDYVADQTELNPALSDSSFELAPGCPTSLRCLGPDGAAINQFAVEMSGKGQEATWKLVDGLATSRAIPVGTWQTMLVVPDDQGHHLFSEPIQLECKPASEVVHEIKVQPGVQLSGRLSENVPRPVVNGSMIAFCVPNPQGSSLWESPAVSWHQSTAIAADGTFQFDSLPPSRSIQLIALADGWLIEGHEGGFTKGLMLSPSEAQLSNRKVEEVVLPMEPTGSLAIKVVDAAGKPLKGVSVHSWPNQAYAYGGGSTLLGSFYSSINIVNAQLSREAPPQTDLTKFDRYNATTDVSGQAVLRDLPLNQPLYAGAMLEGYDVQLPTELEQRMGGSAYQLDSAKPKSITLRMNRNSLATSEKAQPPTEPATANKPSKDSKRPSSKSTQVEQYDVALLDEDKLLTICRERVYKIDDQVRQLLVQHAASQSKIPDDIQPALERLREGQHELSVHTSMFLLAEGNPGALAITKLLASHNDPIVQFQAHLVMAMRGDSDASKSLHKLIHDKTFAPVDRQVICTWSAGVGLRPSDSAEQIAEHFADMTRETPKFKAGDLAPDFEVETIDGIKLSSQELRGKVVLLHFWATSCGPCMGQMPAHVDTLSKYDRDKLVVIFVSLDDDEEKFDQAVKKYNLTFHNVRDARGWGGDLTRAFAVNSMPFDIIIDGEGRIVSNSLNDLSQLLNTNR